MGRAWEQSVILKTLGSLGWSLGLEVNLTLSYTQIEKKLEPLPQDEDQHEDLTQSRRPLTGCTIFLGYTSNLISSGIRETIRYLVQHNMVRS